jgi:hypothetical protein
VLREAITRIADDLWAHFGSDERGECDDVDGYPPG